MIPNAVVVEDGRVVGIATTNNIFYKIVNPLLDIDRYNSYLSSVIYQGTTYSVYSIQIQGSDYSESIALRIAKAGKTVGFYYYCFRYERQ